MHQLKSQLAILQSEKELTESKLGEALAQVSSLETENWKLKSQAESANGMQINSQLDITLIISLLEKVKYLEESVAKDQKSITDLHQRHAEEVAEVKREMMEQLTSERERLLNQIRELTTLKDHANAVV